MQLSSFLALAAILFCIGLYGVLTKRNAVIVLFSIELMMSAANINLVAFGRYGFYPNEVGQIFSVFSMVIAAAEAAVAIAILLAVYRNRNTSNVDQFDTLKD